MRRRRVAGQSLTEYVMLLMVVAGLAKILNNQLGAVLGTVAQPFVTSYAQAYKYGRVGACGKDYDGDPASWTCASPPVHPRYPIGGNVTMMFARGTQ